MRENDEKSNLRKSYMQFEVLLKISLIIGILIVSGFIIYYILTPEPGYVTLGILNEDKLSNYGRSKIPELRNTLTIYIFG
ncbi:hypothetical protein LCGC14_2706660 [marine sediment metagenome]|uniref:Uncharacterized protein n=1 Tax=marine sediment metagenome TaxID=412755 RepID=A0A0F9A1U4_9ZZZZ